MLLSLLWVLPSLPSRTPTLPASQPRHEAVCAAIRVRTADGTEVVPSSSAAIFRPVSTLLSRSLFEPETERDQKALAALLGRALVDHFSPRNREQNALAIAEDSASGEVVGSCGIELVQLSSSSGNSIRRMTSYDEGKMALRPLLSNLAVAPEYRRKGIAKRLCREAEAEAKSWGCDEVWLKGDKSNRKAKSLYRSLGYRPVAEDDKAEMPEAGGGRVRYVGTTNVAMRKDLRRPPTDTVVKAAVLVALLGVAAKVAVEQPETINGALGALGLAL